MVPILPFGSDCCALRERGGGEGPEDATLASVHPGRLQKFLCMVGLGCSRPLHSTISLWLGILNANAASHARKYMLLRLLPRPGGNMHGSHRGRDNSIFCRTETT